MENKLKVQIFYDLKCDPITMERKGDKSKMQPNEEITKEQYDAIASDKKLFINVKLQDYGFVGIDLEHTKIENGKKVPNPDGIKCIERLKNIIKARHLEDKILLYDTNKGIHCLFKQNKLFKGYINSEEDDSISVIGAYAIKPFSMVVDNISKRVEFDKLYDFLNTNASNAAELPFIFSSIWDDSKNEEVRDLVDHYESKESDAEKESWAGKEFCKSFGFTMRCSKVNKLIKEHCKGILSASNNNSSTEEDALINIENSLRDDILEQVYFDLVMCVDKYMKKDFLRPKIKTIKKALEKYKDDNHEPNKKVDEDELLNSELQKENSLKNIGWQVVRRYNKKWYVKVDGVWLIEDSALDEDRVDRIRQLKKIIKMHVGCSFDEAGSILYHLQDDNRLVEKIINPNIVSHFKNGYLNWDMQFIPDTTAFSQTQIPENFIADLFNDTLQYAPLDDFMTKQITEKDGDPIDEERRKSIFACLGTWGIRSNEGCFWALYSSGTNSGKSALTDLMTVAINGDSEAGMDRLITSNPAKNLKDDKFSLEGLEGRTGYLLQEIPNDIGDVISSEIKLICSDSKYLKINEKHARKKTIKNYISLGSTTNYVINFFGNARDKSMTSRFCAVITYSLIGRIDPKYTQKYLDNRECMVYLLHKSIYWAMKAITSIDPNKSRAERLRFNSSDTDWYLSNAETMKQVNKDILDLFDKQFDDLNAQKYGNEIVIQSEIRQQMYWTYVKNHHRNSRIYKKDEFEKDVKRAIESLGKYSFSSKRIDDKECFIITKLQKESD